MTVPMVLNWESSASMPPLAERYVCVWRADLTVMPSTLERLARTLSLDETRRADHFRDALDRSRFVVAHGMLREILGQSLRLDPAKIRILTDEREKPFLADRAARVEFSLAHSGPIVLIAVGQGQTPGIDVEAVRDLPELLDVAARTLTPAEFAAFSLLPRADQVARFYRYWTGKEAVLKALGTGLTADMRRLSADLDGAPLARVLQQDTGRLWTLTEFCPAPDFWGALAVEQRPDQLRFFDWRADESGLRTSP